MTNIPHDIAQFVAACGNSDDRRSGALAQEYVGLGAAIARVRKAKGWSQAELAERAGVSKSSVERAEGGRRTLPLARQRLATALGTTVGDLMGSKSERECEGSMQP